jgi:hypothetical protein
MSSLRALKRKSLQKQKINKENKNISKSWPNITDNREYSLKRSKSESDISNADPPMKDIKFHAKSSLELQSVFKSTAGDTATMSSPESNFSSSVMQSSMFSVITDSEQIKVPIIGYEVMEERSRFTVGCFRIFEVLSLISSNFHRFSSFELKTTRKTTSGLCYVASQTSRDSTQSSRHSSRK